MNRKIIERAGGFVLIWVHVITPIVTSGFRVTALPAPDGCKVTNAQIKLGPASIESAVDEVLAAPGVVEAAIKAHPAIYDCVVAGRPSDRWGSEVVAVVRIRDGHDANDAALLAEAQRHIARYKLPKAIVRVEHVVRSPSGKADYRWAKTIASR